MKGPWEVLTIGHSTRTLEAFVSLLKSADVTVLADVRTVPRSRHNPQFNQETLPASLAAAGLSYRHMASLGGLRRPVEHSVNGAWRNASFRGFADYMQTESFSEALEEILTLAASGTPALMCAEAVPWRCHRSLIADALMARGLAVGHILGRGPVRPHLFTPFGRAEGPRVWYPAPEPTEEPERE
jgi:uncharacterized protein (DUF488 family)